MSSGGWVGHTVSKAWHGVTGAVKKTVGAVTGGLFGGYRNYGDGSSQIIIPPSAAPAPTASEQAEYDAAVQNQKKKRGKNSLYVSSSAGSSGGGSGINL
nr:MAG TPA: virion assembly protein [Bacteriophage sp.]